MNEIIRPGAGILFMKVGVHAQETLEAIIARKNKEIEEAGYAMWGYGGNTCHPSTMVQPFAAEHEAANNPIFLCMEEIHSDHWAEPVIAAEYSVDGLSWVNVPDPIAVKGSRFALIIKNLERRTFRLPLNQTKVAVGPKKSRIGSRYVRGRVDKACLEVIDTPELSNDDQTRELEINLVAELSSPYAVFLRGGR